MYNNSDCNSDWPYISHVPSPGYWYFIHGGAGAIMSRGLMDLTTYERCHDFIFGPMPRMSGGEILRCLLPFCPLPNPCLVLSFWPVLPALALPLPSPAAMKSLLLMICLPSRPAC